MGSQPVIYAAMQSTYACLNIFCADVGSFNDPTSTPPNFSPYPGAGETDCHLLQDRQRRSQLSTAVLGEEAAPFLPSSEEEGGQLMTADESRSDAKTLSPGAIAGITIGSVGVMALLALVGLMALRLRSAKRR